MFAEPETIVTLANPASTTLPERNSSSRKSFTQVIVHNHGIRTRLSSFRSYQHNQDDAGDDGPKDIHVASFDTNLNGKQPDTKSGVDTVVKMSSKKKGNDDEFSRKHTHLVPKIVIDNGFEHSDDTDIPLNVNQITADLNQDSHARDGQANGDIPIVHISDTETDDLFANRLRGNTEAMKRRIKVTPYIIDMKEDSEPTGIDVTNHTKSDKKDEHESFLSYKDADGLPFVDEGDGLVDPAELSKISSATTNKQNIGEHNQDESMELTTNENASRSVNYDADLSTVSSEKPPSQFASAFEMFSKLSEETMNSSNASVRSKQKADEKPVKSQTKEERVTIGEDNILRNNKDVQQTKTKKRPDTPLRPSKREHNSLQIYPRHQNSKKREHDEMIISPSDLISQSFDEHKHRPKYASKRVPRKAISMLIDNKELSLGKTTNKWKKCKTTTDFQERKLAFEVNGAKNEDTKLTESKHDDSAISEMSNKSKESFDSVDRGTKKSENLKKKKLISLYSSLPGVKLSPFLHSKSGPEPTSNDTTNTDVTIKTISDKSESTFLGDMSYRDMYESMAVGSFWRDSAPDQSLSSAAQSFSFADSSQHGLTLPQDMKQLSASVNSISDRNTNDKDASDVSPSVCNAQESVEVHTIDDKIVEAEEKPSAFKRSRIRSSAIDPNVAQRITSSLTGSPKSFYL